ncbi:MAG TPA: CBS domain-containing protein [Methylomirabilota bacterium]
MGGDHGGRDHDTADKVIVVDPRTDLMAALEKLDGANIAQMPVVDAGQLVGMIGREQILHHIRVRAELGV